MFCSNGEKEIFNILESLRKKKKLDEFMDILQKTKIKNSRMLFILKGAYLSELNILSESSKLVMNNIAPFCPIFTGFLSSISLILILNSGGSLT